MESEFKKGQPLVSIWCPTYNHVDYIRDALDGFLMQETNFWYQIVIHDDASDDGTVEILKEYEEKYPLMIKVIYQRENIYHKPNRKQILEKIRREHLTGKYIALCEGDDHWTEKHKLQMQVQFMEENPEYVMTCHGAVWHDCRTGEERVFRPYTGTRELTPYEIIVKENGNIPTASVVIRKEVGLRDESFPKCCVGDIPTQFCAIYKGKVFYFDKEMSVYRYMRAGSWEKNMASAKSHIIKHRIDMMQFYKEYNWYTKGVFLDALYEEMRRCFERNIAELSGLESKEEYERIRKSITNTSNPNEELIIKNMCRIANGLNDKVELSSNLKKFIGEHEEILIYGTGKFAHALTRKFQRNNINITGYLVSDGQNIADSDLLPVWNISDCIVDREKTGVIVATHSKHTNQILEEIQSKYNVDVITPFYIDDGLLRTILLD